MKSKILQTKLFLITIVAIFSVATGGCGLVGGAFDSLTGIVSDSETATVIVNRAQIRSSYAVVAADLLEVRRGERLDILEETDFEKVRWLRVRAGDEDKTEGWIEAQNVIIGNLLEKSKKLAEETRDLPAQATAQLRAAANLRLSPEQKPDNLLFKLEGDAKFEIVGWRYVPKAQEDAAADEANVAKPRTKNAEVEAAKQEKNAEDLDDKYDIWYRVRLAPNVSPAPAGWIYGRQVELQVPSEIVFYQSDVNKFVAWQRLDSTSEAPDRLTPTRDNDLTKTARPSNYVVLTRSNTVKARNGEEPDFDGIVVYGFDTYNKEYYSAYRSPEVWGKIPLRVEGAGDNKTIVLSLSNANGQMEDKRFTVLKDPKGGRLRVNAPTDIAVKK